MQKNRFFLLLIAVTFSCAMRAQQAIGLIPQPREIVATGGTLRLPASFSIGGRQLPDTILTEAKNFAAHYQQVTNRQLKVSKNLKNPFIHLIRTTTEGAEGYQLHITQHDITIKATTTAGFFYAFQTIKKLLPPAFAARQKMEKTALTLPCMSVSDSPRFAYRGFMLDVARHFFGVSEIKRLLDLMANYKMNNFHWHLTDDQGWRIEIKKYPRLTTIGATAPGTKYSDVKLGEVRSNEPYGPFFYTQEEIRNVVAYAHQRHINVIPEIDMPGHFMAAMAAYPEYSCDPAGQHSVWTEWGVSHDVLNVANPAAVNFARDILKEVCDLFPGHIVHIGGDECPDDAWRQNEECQSLYKTEGLLNYRQLQSRFIKQMADYLHSRGRTTAVWNEAITAEGAELDLIKEANVKVYCWYPAAQSARMAAEQKLDNIVTFFGPYYINRRQSTAADEPNAAGKGADSLRVTYCVKPVPEGLPASLQTYYQGVQATFWTEHVKTISYLEYLALPRLLAVAEAGWTPEKLKNYDSFRERVSKDAAYLSLAGFNFCRRDLLKKYVDKIPVKPLQ